MVRIAQRYMDLMTAAFRRHGGDHLLWGNRLFLLSDPGKDAPPTWRSYDLSAGKPVALGVETLSTRHRYVRGDELPAYEVFTDGFMFVRQWREGWGGVCCYDLRKP